VKNKYLFTKNSDVQTNDIRSANIFQLRFTNLSKYQKGDPEEGVKIFNHLPTYINCVANEIKKNEMGWVCGAYGGGDSCAQEFGGEA
jgi:hypothetical protein